MRFYTQQHKHYCGIDLHARMMYLCVLDAGRRGAPVAQHRVQPQGLPGRGKGFPR